MAIIKKCARIILRIRKKESILDGIHRYRIKFIATFDRRIVSNDVIRTGLTNLGISNGDNIMVHCSWRDFYEYKQSPQDFISLLLEVIGDNGTLIMPCYGENIEFFDVDNDKSMAGVLSEVFRNMKGVERSHCSHFACAAYGKYKDFVLQGSENSRYGFDNNSSYYKFTQLDNSKVLMLGLGKKSKKLSLYHVVEYMLIDRIPYFQKLLSVNYCSEVVFMCEGKIVREKHPNMIDRIPTKPNASNIRKIYKQECCKHVKVGNIDMVSIDAKKCLKYISDEALKGNYMVITR